MLYTEYVAKQWECKRTRYPYKAQGNKLLALRKHSILRLGYLIRYADDFVILTDTRAHAEEWKNILTLKKICRSEPPAPPPFWRGGHGVAATVDAPIPARRRKRDSKGTRPFGAAPRRGRPPRRRCTESRYFYSLATISIRWTPSSAPARVRSSSTVPLRRSVRAAMVTEACPLIGID